MFVGNDREQVKRAARTESTVKDGRNGERAGHEYQERATASRSSDAKLGNTALRDSNAQGHEPT